MFAPSSRGLVGPDPPTLLHDVRVSGRSSGWHTVTEYLSHRTDVDGVGSNTLGNPASPGCVSLASLTAPSNRSRRTRR